jgi:hypothetical protein
VEEYLSTSLDYRDTPIKIRCGFSSKYLFTAKEIEVIVNGQRIAVSGGYFFNESVVGSFTDKTGTKRQIEVQCRENIFCLTSSTYIVCVDGIVFSQGTTSIQDAGCGYFIGFIVLLAVTAVTLAILVAP